MVIYLSHQNIINIMLPPENLTPEENREIDKKIQTALFDAETGSHSYTAPETDPAIADKFYKSLRDFEERAQEPPKPLNSIVPLDDLPAPDELVNDVEAESAVDKFLQRLSEAGILLDDYPYSLSATEFYTWLTTKFALEEVSYPIGDGWRCHYSYAELEPRSPENMLTALTMFFDALFNLSRDMDCWMLAGATFDKADAMAPPNQDRYMRAWRDSFRELKIRELTPLTATELPNDQAIFKFEITYLGTTEDGRPVHHSGQGETKLIFEDPYWSVMALSFPGFSMRSA